MSHIFVSYSRKDIDFAGEIVEALAKNNLKTWIDWKSIPKGEDWEREIYRGIEEADTFLFLISPDSAKSDMCNKEIAHAIKNNKRILPIVIRDTNAETFPYDSTKKEIARLNWVFCRKEQDNFEKSIEDIQITIRTDYAWVKYHTDLQIKAINWEKRKNASWLIRGKELLEAEEELTNGAAQDPQPTELQRQFILESRRRETRVRNLGLVIATGVIVALLFLSAFALNQMRQAQEKARVALARELAAESLLEIDRQRELAFLLSVEAVQHENTWNTRNSLFTVIQSTSSTPNGQPLTGHKGIVNSVTFSPNGKFLASGSDDATIRIWDALSTQPIGSPLTGHTAAVSDVAFSPDSKILASSSKDGTIRLWNVASGELIGSPLAGHTDEVNNVAFSPDGKTLASAGRDHTVRLWDIASGRLLMTLTGHTGYVSSVVFSPDGKLIASAGQDNTSYTIRLWDANSGKPRGRPLIGHTYWVTSLAFSPNGKMLASSSQDKTVRLWNVESGKPFNWSLWGDTDWVTDVAFSPDGQTLVSSSFDKTIRLWDANTGQQLGPALTGHTDWITSVAFSPNGKLIASGSEDKMVRLWALGPAAWIELACKAAGRNFTRAEWELYLPDERYHATCPEWLLEP